MNSNGLLTLSHGVATYGVCSTLISFVNFKDFQLSEPMDDHFVKKKSSSSNNNKGPNFPFSIYFNLVL